MMMALSLLLRACDIPFDAMEHKVMCYGHVVDLSSGCIIRGVTTNSADSVDNWNGPPLCNPATQTYEQALSRDPIALARTVVQVIRGSGKHRDAFDDIIVNGNAKDWFKEGQPPKVVKLKQLQLLRDVSTQWDSMYYMLNRLWELRPVCHLGLVEIFLSDKSI
jgi:hypothetical protein